MEIAGVKPEHTVIVLGCGPVGLLAKNGIIKKDVKGCIAVDCVDYRLKHAKKYKV